MANLALAYEKGEGTAADAGKFFTWIRKAAEAGDAQAMMNLALAYDAGKGTRQDAGKFLDWTRRAAEAGEPRAMFNLAMAYWSGTGLEADPARYYEWTRKAAGAGDTRAKFNLALAYEIGKGVEVDTGKYLQWLLSAAEDGEPVAMYNTALCYRDGVGTRADAARCFAWMRRAAESGYIDAMYHTALAFETGQGTPVDNDEFQAWITRAADAGHRDALVTAKLAHLKSRGVIDASQRRTLETAFAMLMAAVRDIKNDHIVDSAPEGAVHFASSSTLISMLPLSGASTNHVRLYNTAYCTDAWEGRRLTELDDDDALLLGSFLNDAVHADTGGPETDYAVYMASLSLAVDSPPPLRAGADGDDALRIVVPLAAFDQRRATSRPLDPVRRPILPGPLVDPKRADGTLYRVKYEDAEARRALSRLREPLAAIGLVSDKVAEPDGVYDLVRVLVAEVLHLYQYQERRHEQESRLLASLPISSPLIDLDDSTPGRLFVRSPDVLFAGAGTRILVTPNSKDAGATMLNLKHRLARQGLLGTTSVDLGS
jgi:TPR repeat protein